MRIVKMGLRGYIELSLFAAVVFCSTLLLTQNASAQSSQPLAFGNNYFVTGDYVVAGVGLRGLGVNGFASGTITLPDANSVPSTGVPAGADIVGAFLYWATVESSQSAFQGQQGFFRGYPITGVVLGNPNAPVSWSSGGCTGSSNGSKTIRTYRADVRGYMPVNPDGTIQANNSYSVKLADSGTNGAGAPFTLGASLVIVYRVLDKTVPLNSILIYDGAYAPSNAGSTMSQVMQGFYQPSQTTTPIAKLTHIVGNGQANKYEQVFFGTQALTPPNAAAFPGFYNGSWDNPTYSVTVNPADTTATTSVVPSASNSGCVNWGTVIMSTTVQDTDGDGLLDVWENNKGYCDATDTSGTCDSTHSSWVALPGADASKQDLYIQLDYLSDSTHSHLPPQAALTAMSSSFAARGITLHLDVKNAVPEQTCSDDLSASPKIICAFPGQPGVVGWKGGFEFLKNQPLNYPDEATCEANSDCVRRFKHGRKDSYHYALFGHALGTSNWSFRTGNLLSVSISGTTATFTTSVPHGLVVSSTDPKGRITISDAITTPALNGVYFVATTPSTTTFTVQLANVTTTVPSPTPGTDPSLAVTHGLAGSGSGFSDIGGGDSLITLGLWGPDGQTVNTQAGTFMHELGHSIALTHGGYYFDNATNKYVPTIEGNCKPNYQSVMNYLFQLDLLGPDSVLDYSGQKLDLLNENSLTTTGVTFNGGQPGYSTTKWYSRNQVIPGIGSAATRHCDGTPLLSTDLPMYRLEGSASPISWSSGWDINYDGKINTSLRGFDDWQNVDLRQIGATGSDVAGGIQGFGGGIQGFGGGIQGFGGGIQGFGGGIQGFGGGIQGFGGGIQGFGGGSDGEIDINQANSVVRPPRTLTAAVTATSPRYIQLNWNSPTFGQTSSYNVYRGVDGAVPTLYATVTGNPPATSYLDKNVTCGPNYTYFVTALLSDGRESSPSNIAGPLTACHPPYIFTGFYSPLATAGDSSYSGAFNISKSITAKWSLQEQNGATVGNLNANVLWAVGPLSLTANNTCPLPSAVPKVFGFPGTYPNSILLYSPTAGAKGNSTFRISSSNNQFIFNWDTSTTKVGCYILEVDLDSGQVFRTAMKLQ